MCAVWYEDPRVKVKSAEVEQPWLIVTRNAAQKVSLMNSTNSGQPFSALQSMRRFLSASMRTFLALKFLQRALRLGKRASAWEEVALVYDPGIETKLRAGGAPVTSPKSINRLQAGADRVQVRLCCLRSRCAFWDDSIEVSVAIPSADNELADRQATEVRDHSDQLLSRGGF
jgi:hypothetical protein